MPIEQNKRVVRRLFEDDLNERDPEVRACVASEIFAPDFYDETNPEGMRHGLEGHNAIVSLFQGAFPGMHWVVQEMVAEGDTVVARTLMTGTHRGEFFGIPATGREVQVAGMHMLTLRDGKIVLHQGVNDDLGMMRQLGVLPG
jgi:steroid delta-isomerase-like uncharacterized protein